MDFVDDINFVARLRRRVAHVFAQLAHLFDAVVTRAVDFENVERIAGRNFLTVVASPVRSDCRPFLAIERLRQNAGGRSFPNPAGTDEKVSMREAILGDRILERARDVRLADQIVERLRTIFAGENFVTHKISLNALLHRRK